ncbi:MAG TPA: arsenate reductase (glutaredoxin) [Caulobacteraceae bacterium]|jgi:arsenate reductase
MSDPSPVTIFHNPACSTSRKALEAIRASGREPRVVEYLKTGWTVAQLKDLLQAMKARPRDILRVRGTPAEELGLTNPAASDETLLAAMTQHPVLVERPIVVTAKGTVLARPVERLQPYL